VLKVNNLTVPYGAMIAVNGVTLSANRQEIISIVGSNGAGKTTLIRGISGLIPSRSDGIVFEGQRIDCLAPHEIVRRGIVQIPEGRGIFSRLSVAENLALGGFCEKSKKEKGRRLDRVFELFPDLEGRLDQRSGTLSGGQQQMLAIGRGMMANPRLLMLDEPSLGVAPIIVEKIFATIQRINQEGVSILLVEQRVRESLEIASRGYVMQTGKIVLEGTGDSLLKNELMKKYYLGM
jgi:branched-chain amino acid transport system ATP-binding protein